MILRYLTLFCLSAGIGLHAQQTEAGKPTQSPELASKSKTVATLEYSKPQIVSDLDAEPMIAGRFDCDEDGTTYTYIVGYALGESTPYGKLALVGIHPDGTITNFPWRSIPGYRNISMPKSIFIRGEKVYVLANGLSDPSEPNRRSQYPLILEFNKQGRHIQTVVLEQGTEPAVLGVFPSGNMLLISEDTLNHRMALNLVNADGIHLRDLPLGAFDFADLAAKMPAETNKTGTYSRYLLIAMSKLFPSDNNLVLFPLETSGLPIIELNERGVLNSVTPRLPMNTVVEGFISSNASSWNVRLGKVLLDDNNEALDSEGKILGVATEPSEQITEISRTDGSLLREIAIGASGVVPTCEKDGTFRFLTTNAGQGRLQVTTARVR